MPAGRPAVTIGLLRDEDPAMLLLPGGRRLTGAAWRAHRQQWRDYVLVAVRETNQMRVVVGSLELSIRPDPAGRRGAFGMIDRLYVAPSCRRLGLGSALIGAALTFRRERGLSRLREHIPNLLRADAAGGRWQPYLPQGDGWGGLRSLGATANACAAARQPCIVAGITRRAEGDLATVGAFIEMPGGDPSSPPLSAAGLRARLLAAVARQVAVARAAATAA